MSTSKERYEDAKVVAAQDPEEPGHREALAERGFCLLVDYLSCGELKAANVVYEELRELAWMFPKELAPRLAQAKAATNMISAWGASGDLDKSHALHQEQQALVNEYQEKELVQEQAKGALNCFLARHYCGDLAGAQECLEEIKELMDQGPLPQEVRMVLDRLGLLPTDGQKAKNVLTQARTIYARLKKQAQANPKDQAKREERVKGALAVCVILTRQGDVESARAWLAEAQNASLQGKVSPEAMRAMERMAEGLDRIEHKVLQGSGQDPEAAKSVYEGLKRRAEVVPESKTLVAEQAKGAFSVAATCARSGDPAEAKIWLSHGLELLGRAEMTDELRNLARQVAAFVNKAGN